MSLNVTEERFWFFETTLFVQYLEYPDYILSLRTFRGDEQALDEVSAHGDRVLAAD